MSLTVHTEQIIDAPPGAVWEVLTDLEHYPTWNPFIIEAQGTAEVGRKLRITIRLGESTFGFRPTVTEANPPHTLEWLGRLFIPGIFDGRHRFELHSAEHGATRLVHSERFSGFAVRLIPGLEQKTLAGFEAMNRAIASTVCAQ